MVWMRSIKSKLSLIMLIIMALSLCTLGIINYWNAKKIVTLDAEESLQNSIVNNAEKFALWVNARKGDIAILANSPILMDGNSEDIVKYLQKESKRNSIYLRFGVADLNGNAYYSNGSKAMLADRAYFQQAKSGNIVISDPVVAQIDGKLVTVVAAPIIKDGKIIGVLGGTVTIDDLIQLVLNIKVAESGYAFVTQSDGLTIIHPDKEAVMKNNPLKDANADPALRALTERMVKGEEGVVKDNFGGIAKYVVFTPIPGTAWSLAENVPVHEVTSKLNSLMWSSVLITVLMLAVVAGITFLFANRITAPIKKLCVFANSIAQGDLKNMEANIHSNDEIGELAQSFKVMSENLRSLIGHVTDASQQVTLSANELTINSEQSVQAVNQVAISITDVANGTEQQMSAVNKASDIIQQMSVNLQHVSENANNAVEKSSQTSERANDGGKLAEKAVRQMAKIEEIVNILAEIVAKLGNNSQEIGQIVDTIAGIAGQTNLLALNAAIEAARAGEQGRGFAVVAEEVRKLAEQSQQSAKQIASLIAEIQGDTDKAVTAMSEGIGEVKLGGEVVENAGKAFHEIAGQIVEVSDRMRLISTDIQQMASGSEHIVSSVKEINELSKKATGEAQTVSAATEEQLASMEQIASSSQSLATMAKKLQQTVERFRY